MSYTFLIVLFAFILSYLILKSTKLIGILIFLSPIVHAFLLLMLLIFHINIWTDSAPATFDIEFFNWWLYPILVFLSTAVVTPQYFLYNIVISFLIQFLIVILSPSYVMEKSKDHFKQISIFFGIIMLVVLIYSRYSAEQIVMFFNRFPQNHEVIIEFSKYMKLFNVDAIKEIYERSIQIICLPYVVGSLIFTFIIERKESKHKKRSMEHFKKAIEFYKKQLRNEVMIELKKSVYFGGESAEALILTHPNLCEYYPKLITEREVPKWEWTASFKGYF